MLTFTPLEGPGCRIAGTGFTLSVFPKDDKAAAAGTKNALLLRSTPDEEDRDGVISWPGEYNVMGVTVRGIGHKEGQQVSYVIDAEDARVLCISEPVEDWADREVEMVGDVDVLVAPVSEAKILQKLIDEFDPRILILMPSKGATDSVLKTLGSKGDTISEYKLKGAMPAEGREVVVLAE